ncbi:sigma-54-dependent Fis family transcriptional regulator [Thiocystis violacea]|uniref:sigma-54-dependent Fis family transcriptional regulator n=1 Tax=Thiocystis violacea TaxID=13725 RepID=UPI0019050FC4|nr:sigma-54-dependent Fis family transcriptional regulator [Thiocystis violacea]MBK1716531.1 Fis family transcriptional regulator [Thiocystis violacea]
MEDFQPILLEVWRRACRQPRLSEAASGIAEILRRRFPLDRLLVLALDHERSRLTTAAMAGGEGADPEPDSLEIQANLPRWCLGESLLRGPAHEVKHEFPGLLPPDWPGDVLACGLGLDDEPLGALILGASQPGAFQPGHEPLMSALREPLAVALRNDRRLRELTRLREAAEADRRSLLSRLGRQDISDTLIGAGSGLRETLRGVDQVARSDAPVLILGETGSGKEVIARAIHARSARAAGPFLRVNCGAIPPELADSELFGHERGSFTGAATRRKGWFERADGGTLFLDEIGELTPAIQVRLLRILQDGTFERVGGQQPLRVEVRLIAATHRDLHGMVRDGRFREDLWYRINVFPLTLPALRERREDIPAMATHFALRAAERLGLTPRLPSTEDMARLIAYPWPGNVRELAAVIERAAILGEGRRLEIERALGVGSVIAPAQPSAPAERIQERIEPLDTAARLHIERALAMTLGRIEGPFGAARLLKIHPDTLRARMRKLGVDWRRHRATDPG